MAPGVGLEPTTNRLTADRSTTELPRNLVCGGAQNTRGDFFGKDNFLLSTGKNRPDEVNAFVNPQAQLRTDAYCGPRLCKSFSSPARFAFRRDSASSDVWLRMPIGPFQPLSRIIRSSRASSDPSPSTRIYFP